MDKYSADPAALPRAGIELKMVKAKAPPKQQRKPQQSKTKGQISTKKPVSSGIPVCCECGVTIEDDRRAIQCERCSVVEIWKCAECLGLNVEQYEFLATSEHFHWFCEKCEDIVVKGQDDKLDIIMQRLSKMEQSWEAKQSGIDQIIATVDNMCLSIHELQSKLDSKADNTELTKINTRMDQMTVVTEARVEPMVGTIVTNLDSTSTVKECVESILKTQLQDDKDEDEERKKRKTNIIVHGVTESAEVTPEMRITDDIEQLQGILHQINCDTVNVQQVIRLGRRTDDELAKPRPMKVILDTEDTKDRVLRNTWRLKTKDGPMKNIFLHQDLTPRQRESRKILITELKRRTEQGETDLTIYNGKVVKKGSSSKVQ